MKAKKFFFTAVVSIMCLCCVVFGAAGAKPARKLDAEERPFEIFTTLAQLNEYRQSHEGDFFNLTDEQYACYDEEFFEKNALVMFLTQGMSGSIRCVAEECRLENTTLYVRVKELSPPMHTMDLHYNTLAVAVPRNAAKDITAVYVEAHRVEL